MSYKVNLEELSGIYALPAAVVDKHIKLAGAIQLKVLLLGLKTPGNIDELEIADRLSVSVPDVTDALNYWVDLGVLSNSLQRREELKVESENKPTKPAKKVIRAAAVKPTREEVAKRGNESSEIAFLLREAQMKLSRPLKQNEASTLVWLHDDEGMEIPVLLLLVGFAVSEGKATIGFIEKTAINWINDGVSTVQDAENKISNYHEMKSAWSRVEKAMGIAHRMPSTNESKLAYTWVYEYGFTGEILRKAYDTCVDSTSNFSVPYIKKILETWHAAGVKTIADIESLKADEPKSKKAKGSKTATFDVELYNKTLKDLPE